MTDQQDAPQGEHFDNSPIHHSRPVEVDALLNALEVGDPRAEELGKRVEQVIREVRSQGYGSMFGVAGSMRNMADTFEALLRFLPKNFVWPTIVDVSPFSVYAEWGRQKTTDRMERSVWFIADPNGVKMNANFRPGWPECGASDFDAQTAARWLQELTANWEWSATQNGSITSSSLQRRQH